jgi:hypothetical protein
MRTDDRFATTADARNRPGCRSPSGRRSPPLALAYAERRERRIPE